MNKKVFEDFHSKLTSFNLHNNNEFEKEITIHYFEILEILATDFESYRKYSPLILSSLEANNRSSLSHSLLIFSNLFEKLANQNNVYKLDQSVMKAKITGESNSKFFKFLEESLKKNNQSRISDFEFPSNDLTELEIKEIICLQINMIQESAKEIDWKEEQCDNIMLQLPILRHLLVRLNNPELFYFIIGIFVDRLNSSEFYQAARDNSEEIIISSFNDEHPQFGFFIAFKCYSAQGSTQAALLYANVSMYLALKNSQGVSDKYLQGFIWQSMICFRNARLYPHAVEIYNNIPKTIGFSGYHQRSIDHSYFTILLLMDKEKLPDLLLDYLNKERENIFSGGVHESLPWLITLYNVKRVFSNANFTNTGLGYYLDIFEQIVPKESIIHVSLITVLDKNIGYIVVF